MRTLLIIPAYNEAENIRRVVGELSKYPQYDYIVVNDCSTDETLAILQSEGWPYLNQPVNLGIGGTVQCGYLYARDSGYDIAVQMDGDGQHDPADVAALIAPIEEGCLDMVVGSRFLTKQGFQTSIYRRMGIQVIRFVIRLCCGQDIKDTTSGFRAVNRKVMERFAREYAQDYPEPEAILSAVLGGLRVGEVPARMRERIGGVSSINPLKSIYYMIKVSLSLCVRRLQQAGRREGKAR